LFSEGRDGVREELLLHSNEEPWMPEKLRQGIGTAFGRLQILREREKHCFFFMF
jgi:hypothetical protein